MSEFLDKAILELIDATESYLSQIENSYPKLGLDEIQRFDTLVAARQAMILSIPNNYFTNPYTSFSEPPNGTASTS